MTDPTAPSRGHPAIVVFADSDAFWWMRFLRPGFRHCFVCVGFDTGWVTINPLSHFTDIGILAHATPQKLSDWFGSQRFTACSTFAREPVRTAAPVRPFTCVEVVKRVLGVHAPWVLTPWQLYCRLKADDAVNRPL